jgi:hypothetical protein
VISAERKQRREEISIVRPANGWENFLPPYAGRLCLAVENRTGQRVHCCERFPDLEGKIGVGCCWFYFDDADRVLDAAARLARSQTPHAPFRAGPARDRPRGVIAHK